MKLNHILIVDDDVAVRRTLSAIFEAKGYVTSSAATGKTALERVRQEVPAVALVDLKLADMSGLELMVGIQEECPGTECIVLTGHASQASAIEAVNLGAYSYVQKPCDMDQLLLTIRRAIETREAEETLRIKDHALASALNGFAIADLVGNLTYVNNSWRNYSAIRAGGLNLG